MTHIQKHTFKFHTRVSVVTGSTSHIRTEKNKVQINEHLFPVNESYQKLLKVNQNLIHSLKLMQKLVYFILSLLSVEFREKPIAYRHTNHNSQKPWKVYVIN